jgi:hypothetical protein
MRLTVADKGFLGMVNNCAKSGDMLFYLVGCSKPVVLRRVRRGTEAGATVLPRFRASTQLSLDTLRGQISNRQNLEV